MKMLIIDDCELIQNRLSKSIAKIDEKIRISQANSCLEAIKTFADINPDTVILDISLPDGSGIDLLKKFKTEKPGTKVLLFTNYPSDEFKKRCNDLGADYFFDKSNFLGLINIVINRTLVAAASGKNLR